MYSYRVFGLGVHSELPLPELAEAPVSAEVEFYLGHVDAPAAERVAPGRLLAIGEREAYLAQEGIGAFLIRDGREVRLDPASEAVPDLVRLHLLGPVLALLLHQRGLVVLHASAVALPGGCVTFLGASGSGKSTAAAALVGQGHRLLADDVTVVTAEIDPPAVLPGPAVLRLWPESTGLVNEDSSGLPRLHPSLEKRAYAVPGPHSQSPGSLRRLYVLAAEFSGPPAPLPPALALIELERHCFGAHRLKNVAPDRRFRRHERIATTVPARVLGRSIDADGRRHLARLIEEDLDRPS